MLTVHHLNNSRSQRILWLLEELGVAYEIKFYERNAKTQLAPPELKQVHSLGKSPVITDGDQVLAESGAIIEYLGRTYGGSEWWPDGPSHQSCVYWLHYAEGSLMPPLLLKLVFDKVKTAPMPFFVKPIAKGIANKVMSSFVTPNLVNHFQYIENHLGQSQYFVGDAISVADVQMSFPLEASLARGTVSETSHPNIAAWVQKVHARPAYQAALEKGGEYDYS